MTSQVVDTRTEMKITQFSGEEKDWAVWSLRFEAYSALIGYEDIMAHAAAQTAPLDHATLSERALVISKALWHLLIMKCEGKAMSLARAAGKHNGLEAWRLMKIDYEGVDGSRQAAMLRYILNPGQKWKDDEQKQIPFLTSLQQWQQVISDYDDQTATTNPGGLQQSVLCSVVIEHAPQVFKEMLLGSSEVDRASILAMRTRIRTYFNQSRQYSVNLETSVPTTQARDSGGPKPMDVDQIRQTLQGQIDAIKGGKGKHGKGKFGKGKHGKDGKNNKGKKGKTKHENKGRTPFQGECGFLREVGPQASRLL